MNDQAQETELRALTDDVSVSSYVDNEDIFVPLLFDAADNPHKPTSAIIQFKAKELRFLRAFDHNTTISEAATKAGITPEYAKRFLAKSDTRAWMWDRAQKAEVAQYWLNGVNCIAEGAKVLNGASKKDDIQFKIWKEFIDRALPKLTRTANETAAPKIEINIDSKIFEEARRKSESIDVELSNEYEKK